MTKFFLNLIFVSVVALFGTNVVLCQSTEKSTINPPKWILGSWNNSAESDSRRLETFAFVANEIKFSEGFESEDEAVALSEKFKGYEIEETIEAKLYRITFLRDASEYVYEFKICDDCNVSSIKETALTYSVTENGKAVRVHSTSAQAVLIRRTKC